MCSDPEWEDAVEQWLDMGDGDYLAARLLDEHREEVVRAIAESLAHGWTVVDICQHLPWDRWLNAAADQISRYASSRQGGGDDDPA